MQPLDQETELPDLPLTLAALAPLADFTAKPLDFDQDFFVRATPIALRRSRRRAAVAGAALANLFLEALDFAAQRVDRLQQLGADVAGRHGVLLSGIARRTVGLGRARIIAATTRRVTRRACGHLISNPLQLPRNFDIA
jgi:hypothetical protein